MESYYLYNNSEAQGNGTKGFVIKIVKRKGKCSTVQCTTEFAFALEFYSLKRVTEVKEKNGLAAIVLYRVN